MTLLRRMLCKIGLHQWHILRGGESEILFFYSGNMVREKCKGCSLGKVFKKMDDWKKWIEENK